MHTRITITTASQKLNLSPHSVKRWINQGKLNGEKVNGKWHVIDDEMFEQHLHTNGAHLPTSDEQHPHTNDVHPHTGDTHLHTKIEHLNAMIAERSKQLDEKEARISDFREQQARKDEQIDHLTQVVAMSQKNIATFSEQLDTERRMLEDMRRRSWFKRLFRRD